MYPRSTNLVIAPILIEDVENTSNNLGQVANLVQGDRGSQHTVVNQESVFWM